MDNPSLIHQTTYFPNAPAPFFGGFMTTCSYLGGGGINGSLY